MRSAKAIWIGLVVGAALAADQTSKSLALAYFAEFPRPIEITSFLNLRLGFNTGISFGLFRETLQNAPYLIALANLAIVSAFVLWAWRTENTGERLGLSLVMGGALGNIADRFRQGAVTDFLDFHWQGWHWPTFNAADVFIAAGTANLLLSMVRTREGRRIA